MPITITRFSHQLESLHRLYFFVSVVLSIHNKNETAQLLLLHITFTKYAMKINVPIQEYLILPEIFQN